MKAAAFAPTNIALAKYWGKRSIELNLPTNGSLSITLDKFGSTTSVEIDPSIKEDSFTLNGKRETNLKKVSRVLDSFRKISAYDGFFRIESSNNFPTGAGLASSASGLAALTLATAQTLKLDLTKTRLSEIARLGSGSACRSFDEGFVEWKRGELADGSDSTATSVFSKTHMPLDATIAVVNAETKHTFSTDGMIHTQKTSPYFDSWVTFAQNSVFEIKRALIEKDFTKIASLVESNCLKMHACAMAATPSVNYFKPQTLSIIDAVYGLRSDGCEVFFTIDAGPNIVLFSTPTHTAKVFEAISQLAPQNILRTTIGGGAHLV